MITDRDHACTPKLAATERDLLRLEAEFIRIAEVVRSLGQDVDGVDLLRRLYAAHYAHQEALRAKAGQ